MRHLNLKKIMKIVLPIAVLFVLTTTTVFAAGTMWDLAETLIKDVYTKILGISTVLAGLMSAVAVVGAKMSSNQQKVDKSWDWLKRIWIAWAVINGIGGFITFIKPFFDGYSTITGYVTQIQTFLL